MSFPQMTLTPAAGSERPLWSLAVWASHFPLGEDISFPVGKARSELQALGWLGDGDSSHWDDWASLKSATSLTGEADDIRRKKGVATRHDLPAFFFFF